MFFFPKKGELWTIRTRVKFITFSAVMALLGVVVFGIIYGNTTIIIIAVLGLLANAAYAFFALRDTRGEP